MRINKKKKSYFFDAFLRFIGHFEFFKLGQAGRRSGIEKSVGSGTVETFETFGTTSDQATSHKLKDTRGSEDFSVPVLVQANVNLQGPLLFTRYIIFPTFYICNV